MWVEKGMGEDRPFRRFLILSADWILSGHAAKIYFHFTRVGSVHSSLDCALERCLRILKVRGLVLLSLVPGQNKQTNKQTKNTCCCFVSGCITSPVKTDASSRGLNCSVSRESTVLWTRLLQNTPNRRWHDMYGNCSCLYWQAAPPFRAASGHLLSTASVLAWQIPHAWITQRWVRWYPEPTQSRLERGCMRRT